MHLTQHKVDRTFEELIPSKKILGTKNLTKMKRNPTRSGMEYSINGLFWIYKNFFLFFGVFFSSFKSQEFMCLRHRQFLCEMDRLGWWWVHDNFQRSSMRATDQSDQKQDSKIARFIARSRKRFNSNPLSNFECINGYYEIMVLDDKDDYFL